MKHIKIFETTAEYNAFKLTENFVTPNVSLCEDAPTIMHYEPYVAPIVPQHDYVEIDGIKWATMNVGASAITDTGLYFQWGDTQGYTAEQVGSGEGQKYFGWNDYKYNNNTWSPSASDMTKYNASDGLITLLSEDDAVQVAWGGNWRMPTKDEFIALSNAVNTVPTNDYQNSGIAGLICTDKTDSSKVLFFPYTGIIANTGSIGGNGISANYWTNSCNSANVIKAWHLTITNNNNYVPYAHCGKNDYSSRCYGFPIRGILDDSNS